MKATTSCGARGVRAIAVVAVLLCALVTIAPLIARTSGAHHHRVHLVKVVGPSAADQHSSTLRLDQPGATLQHARKSADLAAAAGTTVSLTPIEDTTVDSARTRGPPTAAL